MTGRSGGPEVPSGAAVGSRELGSAAATGRMLTQLPGGRASRRAGHHRPGHHRVEVYGRKKRGAAIPIKASGSGGRAWPAGPRPR